MNQSEKTTPEATLGFVDVGESNFEAEILKSQLPVIVVFWTPWSNACKLAKPVMETLAQRYAGKIKLARVHADENPVLGMWYEVQYIPTILLFVGSGLRLRLFGTMTEEAMIRRLEPLLGIKPETSLRDDRTSQLPSK